MSETVPAEISHAEIQKIEPISQAHACANEVRVSPKTIQYRNTYSRQVRFERGVAHNGNPDFNITVIMPRVERQKCSLGHIHEKETGQEEYVSLTLSWEHAERLMEWFQSGDYKTVRERTKKLKEERERVLQERGLA